MLTREWLRRLPPEAADRFADGSPRDPAGEAGGLASVAASPAAVLKAAASLSRDAADALNMILIRFGSLPFEREQFEAAAEAAGLPAAAAVRELERLRASGIVLAVRKTWGDRLYFLASDAMAAWMAALLPADMRPLSDGRKSARPLQDYREPYGLQLMQMLAELGKRGSVISADGRVPGRTGAAAAARLSFGPDALEPYAARFGPNGLKEAPLRLGLAAALHLGLLEPSGGRLAWRGEALAAWLAMDAGRRERELLAFVTDRLAACDARFAHAGALLRTLAGGAWYPAAGIDAWFERHVPEAAAHWRVWAGTLAEFGWLQTGVSAEGEPVVRWLIDPLDEPETTAGGPQPGAQVRFLPGAELAVPPDLDLRLRWELELLADKTQPGPMAVMRLTAESYTRWIESGRTAEEALRLLEEAGGCPVPEELERAIRDWEGSAGRIAFREALLMVCDSREIADRAAAEPALAERLGERIGDRHFLIDRRHAAELRRRLAKAGMPARSGTGETDGESPEPYPALRGAGVVSAPTVPEAAGDASVAKAAGLLSGLGLERYAPDAEFRLPAPDSALRSADRWLTSPPETAGAAGRMRAAPAAEPPPANSDAGGSIPPAPGFGPPSAVGADAARRMRAIRLTGLPAHWFGKPRRVHPSTRREMAKRAIEIGAAVRIVREGAVTDIVPERLEETDGGWRLHGRPAGDASDPPVRVALDGDSWTEMALVLPEWIGERNSPF